MCQLQLIKQSHMFNDKISFNVNVNFISLYYPETNIPPVQRQMDIFRKSVNLSILNQFSEKHPKRPIDFVSYIKQPKVPFSEYPSGMSQFGCLFQLYCTEIC